MGGLEEALGVGAVLGGLLRGSVQQTLLSQAHTCKYGFWFQGFDGSGFYKVLKPFERNHDATMLYALASSFN